jgi:hypothetical protein
MSTSGRFRATTLARMRSSSKHLVLSDISERMLRGLALSQLFHSAFISGQPYRYLRWNGFHRHTAAALDVMRSAWMRSTYSMKSGCNSIPFANKEA